MLQDQGIALMRSNRLDLILVGESERMQSLLDLNL